MEMRDRHLLLDVGRLGNYVGAIVELGLREAGIRIPPSLYGLLDNMNRLGTATPSQISQSTGMPMTTLRDNTQRLVDVGLVRRKSNPDDGRSYLIELTRKGDLALRAGNPALEAAYEALEEQLPGPLERYEAVLAEIETALEGALTRLASSTRSAGRRRRREGSAPRPRP